MEKGIWPKQKVTSNHQFLVKMVKNEMDEILVFSILATIKFTKISKIMKYILEFNTETSRLPYILINIPIYNKRICLM